jgi:heat-inducible transcriptional repressor
VVKHGRCSNFAFIVTRPGELLAVIVFSDGTVENRFLKVDEGIKEADLERLHNMLEEA